MQFATTFNNSRRVNFWLRQFIAGLGVRWSDSCLETEGRP